MTGGTVDGGETAATEHRVEPLCCHTADRNPSKREKLESKELVEALRDTKREWVRRRNRVETVG